MRWPWRLQRNTKVGDLTKNIFGIYFAFIESDPILEASTQLSVTDPVTDPVPDISDEVCLAFAKMCHSVTCLLGKSVDVYNLKLFLGFLCESDPQSGQLKRSVDSNVYDEAASTEDVIRCLCPDHISPVKLFVLEGIVKTFGSSQCKRLLTMYKKKYC